jgi:alkylation response protein AidB-like acyl-CoA dehydrogenase
MNFYTDCNEWQYLFRQAIDWKSIIPLYYSNFPTKDGFKNTDELLCFYEDLLKTTGQWTAETLAPRARELDDLGGGTLVDGSVQVSEVLARTYQEARELDIFGLAIDPKYGGMGVPVSVGLLVFEQLCRACVSTGTQIGFFSVIADMIERFCDEETQNKFIPKIQKGEISGSMCMTEPGSGSDVGSIRTSAHKQPNGRYLLNGSKCFITNGGGGLAFILARIHGAPKGLDGISMFFAEEWIDQPTGERTKNYKITKIEEKMGMHGSMTCEVVYENTVAQLVGKENQGFQLMLHLMNEARISVGLQGLGGIEASLHVARHYAQTRQQFGQPLLELPLFGRNLRDWETERDAFRALMVDTISHFDIFQKLHLKRQITGELNQEESTLFTLSSRVVRRRTPLVKYYGAEANAAISQRSIQALGGYGFMVEYDVERLHRDSFGALLYEGTSQIQALMAMKDFLKTMIQNPAKFLQSLLTSHPIGVMMHDSYYVRSMSHISYEFRKNIAILVIKCFKPEIDLSEVGFKEALLQLRQILKREYWAEQERMGKLMVHAETLCQALSYRETLKVLSRHALADSARGDLYQRYLKLVTPRLAAIYSDWKS